MLFGDDRGEEKNNVDCNDVDYVGVGKNDVDERSDGGVGGIDDEDECGVGG